MTAAHRVPGNRPDPVAGALEHLERLADVGDQGGRAARHAVSAAARRATLPARARAALEVETGVSTTALRGLVRELLEALEDRARGGD